MEAGCQPWFRPGLRVKKIQGEEGLWEMTWAPDGRALFAFGPQQQPGKRHVRWVDIGTHAILP